MYIYIVLRVIINIYGWTQAHLSRIQRSSKVLARGFAIQIRNLAFGGTEGIARFLTDKNSARHQRAAIIGLSQPQSLSRCSLVPKGYDGQRTIPRKS